MGGPREEELHAIPLSRILMDDVVPPNDSVGRMRDPTAPGKFPVLFMGIFTAQNIVF